MQHIEGRFSLREENKVGKSVYANICVANSLTPALSLRERLFIAQW